MGAINRKNLGKRAGEVAAAAPSLDERFSTARSAISEHPTVPAAASERPPTKSPAGGEGIQASGEAYFITVSVDLIDENPFNARKVYRPERVNELAASIGAHGQDVPGIATLRDGRYILAAGHYRRRAIKLRGLKTMDLMVHEGLTDKQLFEYSFRENAEREAQSALDNALCWRDLLDQKLYASPTELAEATGISLPNISKTMRILELSEAVLEVVKLDPPAFALIALYELALYEEAAADEKLAVEQANKLLTGDSSAKEIREARAKIVAPKTRKQKETSRAYRIHWEGAEIGTFKEWDSGRLLLDVEVADPGSREKVLGVLKEHFNVAL